MLGLIALLVTAMGITAAPAAGASGPTLDTGFGAAGTARVPVGEGLYSALRPVRQPDGRLLLSGSISPEPVHDVPRAVIARVDRRGKLDRAFGHNGSRQFDFGGFHIGSILPRPDGRILVAGTGGLSEGSPCGGWVFVLVRLLPDGSIDRSFGSRGHVFWRPSLSPDGYTAPNGERGLPSVALHLLMTQPDGSLVAAGSVCEPVQNHAPSETGIRHGLIWVRFDANGGLDAPAGSDGMHRLGGAWMSSAYAGASAWLQSWFPQPGGSSLALAAPYELPYPGYIDLSMHTLRAADFVGPGSPGEMLNTRLHLPGLGFRAVVPARDGGLFFLGNDLGGDADVIKVRRMLPGGHLDPAYGDGCSLPEPRGEISGAALTSTNGLVASATIEGGRWGRRTVLYFSPAGCYERRLEIRTKDLFPGSRRLFLGPPLLERGFRPVIPVATGKHLAAVRLVRAAKRP